MWIFYLLGAGVVALFGYMGLLDLRARRRNQRLHVDGTNARLAAEAEFDRRRPGGAGHFGGGFDGGGPIG
jgi:hypothetical protein